MLTQNALRTSLIFFLFFLFFYFFARTEKLTESTYAGVYFPQLLLPVVYLKAFSLLASLCQEEFDLVKARNAVWVKTWA